LTLPAIADVTQMEKKVRKLQLENAKLLEKGKLEEELDNKIPKFESDPIEQLKVLGKGAFATVYTCKFSGKPGTYVAKKYVLPKESEQTNFH
jgi:hypothetical protein